MEPKRPKIAASSADPGDHSFITSEPYEASVMVMASGGGGGLVQSPPDMLHHHNIMDTSSHVEMMPSELFSDKTVSLL